MSHDEFPGIPPDVARQLREAEALSAVGIAMNESLDIEHVVEVALDRVEELVPNDACALMLIDRNRGMLYTYGMRGRAQEVWGSGRQAVPLGHGGRGRVALTGVPFVTDDISSHPWSANTRNTDTFHAHCAVPIRAGGEILGVMCATRISYEVFSEEDINLMLKLGVLIGTALRNARLYQEVNEAYQQIQIAQEQLVRSERLKALGEMAAGMAHDFNNLLAGILGNVEMLLPGADETSRRRLKTIKQAALDGASAVRRIQEFTNLRRDEDFTSVDLNEIVTGMLEVTRPRWSAEALRRGVTISVRFGPKQIPLVEGNPAELRQALMNIFLNAVDAVSNGGEIAISTDQISERVAVSIRDTGPGMDSETRKHIFEPFFSTKGSKGSGLGLSVVQGIIRRHHGEIEVESTPGEGSLFRVLLPPAHETVEATPVVGPLRRSIGARILLADDEMIVRESIAEMLSSQGYQVSTSHSGKSALDLLSQSPFDLLITDLGMPDLAGNQLALKARELQPGIPVILLTGWGAQISSASPEARAVDRILTKPVELEELVCVVEELLSRPIPFIIAD